MNPDLALVRELQSIDRRVQELSEEIARLPQHVKVIENKLESHKKALAQDRASLEENRKRRRLMDGEVSALQQKISRLRLQMGEAKTNEQFRAFQKEIDFAENEVRKIEDRILDRMVEADTIEGDVKRAEKSLGAEMLVVAEEVELTTARVAKDKDELTALKNKRGQLAGSVSPNVLAMYESIFKLRAGRAVAAASDERCLACNVMLRPHLMQKLRLGQEILTCESCGRILYRDISDNAPLEDPAGESNIAAKRL